MPAILLHSSKTMRAHVGLSQQPALINQAKQLAAYVQSLSATQLAACMALSDTKAAQTHDLWQDWSSMPARQSPAIDSFIGDIYSGLQVQTFTPDDRAYANTHLFILSGLYGVLRALDGIAPYRLEMGYKLPNKPFQNLYTFWGDAIARQLPASETIVNLSAVEYTKVVLPFIQKAQIITPKFLTIDKTGQPNFVVVHAKIARGAFARWLIKERVMHAADFKHFTDLGYQFNTKLGTPEQPIFVCKTFGGLGLSVRLNKN
jgi:cytoplasmic iron level regulating protein YaaA (DUF328/UPF0246 family)